jgi:large subunit ribosomal protein L4
MIQLALRSALSDRASEDRVMVVAEWPWTEPKTAAARQAMATLELDGRILVVLDREADETAYKAFRNLPLIQVILTGELNAYDVLCNDWIVFTSQTLPGEGAEAAEAEGEGTDTTPVAVTAKAAPTPAPAEEAPAPAPEPAAAAAAAPAEPEAIEAAPAAPEPVAADAAVTEEQA